MSGQRSWEEAWERAQPTLASIQTSLSSRATPDARVTRIGQLDSELLDHELVSLLQEPVSKVMNTISVSWRSQLEPELTVLIQLMLYKLSVWRSGATYGAKLQDLKYQIDSASSIRKTPSGLPKNTLVIHGALVIATPYLYNRIRAHALSQAWPDAPSSDRRMKAWELLTFLETSHSALSLLNFFIFLWNGRYRTLADRLLRMRLVSSRRLTKRDVSYEFMNRQMVWHAFTEFLLFILPLVNARTIRRKLTQIASRIDLASILPSAVTSTSKHSAPTSGQKKGKYWSFPEDQCAICADNASSAIELSNPTATFASVASSALDSANATGSAEYDPDSDGVPLYPLYTPYVTSCNHVYCYHCIAEAMMRVSDEGIDGGTWECLRCTHKVKDAKRLEGTVREEDLSDTASAYDSYEFSDMDTTDMSASMGSYSDSAHSDDA